MRLFISLIVALFPASCGGGGGTPPATPQLSTLDLAQVDTAVSPLLRFFGSTGRGDFGVPVAGGADCDGDGNEDFALAAMRAGPLGRPGAGAVFLAFGTGVVTGSVDSAGAHAGVLRVFGDQTEEVCGNEIWIDDVTGDGIGDLLIGRQNFTPAAGRLGAGALSIVVGGAALRTLAASLDPLDLRAPTVTVTTIVGIAEFDRLGIWFRTDDVDGDGVRDIVLGADQRNGRAGEAYVIRGGAHLAAGGSFDLADLDGNLATIRPPAGSANTHFGATCQVADLDGNGRAEVLIASTLFRGGAGLRADGAPVGSARATGGTPRGTLSIAWDDNFPAAPWPAAFSFVIDQSPGSSTIIDGGTRNRRFGEEILGGVDYDGDTIADLFVGDITGDWSPSSRSSSGSGHVLYNAPLLKGLAFDLDNLPAGVAMTTFLGAQAGDIAADTAAHGDFDNDGIGDLVVMAPHGRALGRSESGTAHVFYGTAGGWPAVIDLLTVDDTLPVRLIAGAKIRDVLGYSATTGDPDGDGIPDLIVNEMLGEGASGQVNVGNLIVVGAPLLAR